MGSVRKRRKTWYIDYRVDGKRVVKAIGKFKRVAQLALADVELKIAKRRAGFSIEDKKFSTYLPLFFSHITAHIKPSAVKRYRQILGHFKEFLQAQDSLPVKLSEVKPKLIEAYKLHRLKFIKPQTINGELNSLHRFFGYAIEIGYLGENPTQRIKKFTGIKRRAPRFLLKEEIKRLVEACPSYLANIVIVLINTGFRWAELANLEWDDVDMEKKVLYIRIKDEWRPKEDEERKVPLTDKAVSVLGKLERKNNWVFLSPRGAKLRHSHVWEDFKKVAKKAGLENVTIHSLRHTFASHLVMSGVDLYTVGRLLGHRDIKSTQIYSHLSQDHLRQAVERLEL